MIVTAHHESVRPDHRSVRLDITNTRGRDETDNELMLHDLVHVCDTCNLKTVQSHNRTGFQIVPVVAGPISGIPVNHRVVQKNKRRSYIHRFSYLKNQKAVFEGGKIKRKEKIRNNTHQFIEEEDRYPLKLYVLVEAIFAKEFGDVNEGKK